MSIKHLKTSSCQEHSLLDSLLRFYFNRDVQIYNDYFHVVFLCAMGCYNMLNIPRPYSNLSPLEIMHCTEFF